jgi:hypothetical protein
MGANNRSRGGDRSRCDRTDRGGDVAQSDNYQLLLRQRMARLLKQRMAKLLVAAVLQATLLLIRREQIITVADCAAAVARRQARVAPR